MENHQNTKNSVSENEIDLSVIFKSFKRGGQRIAAGIGYLIYLAAKHFVIVFSFFLIGVALGYLLYKFTKPYYTSSMTLVLADIRNDFVEDQLDKLAEMIKEDNFEAISSRLDISLNSAKTIKKMEFSNLDKVAEDSILTGSPFRIELALYDNTQFNSLETALVNYLENNRYFSKQKNIRQKQTESMIGKLKKEISSIDSIKFSIISPRGPVNGFVYGEPIDPTNLYQESVRMYQRQVDLTASLEQNNVIQVVTGFSPRLKPTGPKWYYYISIGALILSIFGLIFAHKKEKKP